MGSYTFQWPYNANEVYVTGTFDDWGKTVQLEREGDIFAKKVSLPVTGEKVQYKFVVDGTWTTDTHAREENDGHNNVNNVLLPEDITKDDPPVNNNFAAAAMSGVTPDSTTAALAANVPKEEPNGSLPGTFPETPGQEPEQTLSVNPIPASGGYGNPIKLNPGDKVPDPGTIHGNTVDSTVKLDKESYEKGDSVPLGSAGTQNPADTAGSSVPPVSKNMIPESSLPMGEGAQRDVTDPGYTIQSAAPTSTTAALAAAVPLESQKKDGDKPAEEVPKVVKDSMAEAHKHPEAAASKDVVSEKKDVEHELRQKVDVNESAGTPPPAVAAATMRTAPGTTTAQGVDSMEVSPMSTPPPDRTAAPTSAATAGGIWEPKAAVSGVGKEQIQEPTEGADQPTVTTGVASAPTAATTTATQQPQTASPEAATVGKQAEIQNGAKDDKKKKRKSGFFSKLKEKLK